MEMRPITLYTRPECELCDEARGALREVLAGSPLLSSVREVDIEHDPLLHKRLLAEIPAVEYRGELLAHATSRLRIQNFFERLQRDE
jgi:hypothetical protein